MLHYVLLDTFSSDWEATVKGCHPSSHHHRCAADTTDIGTSTVATNFGVLFQQFMIKLHLSKVES